MCVCVCVCVCVCIYIYICTQTKIYAHIHIHTYLYKYKKIYIYTHTHTHKLDRETDVQKKLNKNRKLLKKYFTYLKLCGKVFFPYFIFTYWHVSNTVSFVHQNISHSVQAS